MSGSSLGSLLQACLHSVEEALAACKRIGYPIMLKASWGGGGKGIRKVGPAFLSPGLQDIAVRVFLVSWPGGREIPGEGNQARHTAIVVPSPGWQR